MPIFLLFSTARWVEGLSSHATNIRQAEKPAPKAGFFMNRQLCYRQAFRAVEAQALLTE
jgi:hypothetical protein